MTRYSLFVICLIGLLVISVSAVAEEVSLVKFGSDVEVAGDQIVKDAVAIGGSVRVYGEVKDSAVAVGGSVYVAPRGSVGKDAVSVGGKVTKAAGARVGGNVVEVSGFTVPVPAGAAVVTLAGGIIAFKILVFIGFLALALVTVALFTRQIGLISSRIEKDFWRTVLWGIIGVILICPIIILLAISIVGIILIPIFGLIVTIAFLAGYAAMAQIIGKKIFEAAQKPNQPMMLEETVGLALLFLIWLIPIAGWIIKSLVAIIGLGSVILTRFGTRA